jgi:hypothetical protein
MNLKETIRRILREELSPRMRRRVPADEMEREFLESFEMAYNITKNRKVLSKQFLDELIYTTASVMMSGIHWRLFTTLPEDEFWYDEIHNELENHYRDRIIKMYRKKEGINESILKEESKRDEMVDLYLAKRISSFTKFDMKDGLHPRIEFVDDKSHHTMVVIDFNRRTQKNEVHMDDSLYGEIYNMFSMDGFEEIQKHLKRWFSNNFDGLKDISEIDTFENDEYIY